MRKAGKFFVGVATLALTACTAGGGALPGGAVDSRGSHAPRAGAYRLVGSLGAHAGDGAYPFATVVEVGGVLYGTTDEGGANGAGTLYSMTLAGKVKTLHSFGGTNDGKYPLAALLPVGQLLYGTTSFGGTGGSFGGTVFKFDLRNGTERVLHNFGNGTDASNLRSALVPFNGRMYGASQDGGANDLGTIFSITPAGAEHVVYSFQGGSGDGRFPSGDPVVAGGTLYGLTNNGGPSDFGAVYALGTTGAEHLLYAFSTGEDGEGPKGTLAAAGGALYGATSGGGAYASGTAFKVSFTGSERVVHSFGNGSDGASPFAGLVSANGALYGTTASGGLYGEGTLFSIRGGVERIEHSFGNGTDGAVPSSDVRLIGGKLYGTTYQGGKYNHGAVFSFTP